MTLDKVSFKVDVTAEDATRFAELSGDWNPLHTNPAHAANTAYRYPVLHGAFSAGLFSRMAGMHIPGTDCLLHNLRLRFVAPIIPPASLVVTGQLVSDNKELGKTEVVITDEKTGARYVDGTYEFSRHELEQQTQQTTAAKTPDKQDAAEDPVLVTGANGALGQAVLNRLGERAIGIARKPEPGLVHVTDIENLKTELGGRPVSGIVHCAWPPLDNERLLDLPDIASAVEHSITVPLRQIISLARYLNEFGTDNAMLVLVGSTAALPGRHNYRMPLYTMVKSLVPVACKILATEMGAVNKRCVTITYDVIEGGMNKRLSKSARIAHADRAPTGQLPSIDEAAAQVAWVLNNPSFLVSGSDISLTGSAIP